MALQLRKSPESANYYNLLVIPEKRAPVKRKTMNCQPLCLFLFTRFFHLKVKFYNVAG